ncbi:MAG: hypothetical protein ACR2FH_02035 [Caulobacteraceae bacterium]
MNGAPDSVLHGAPPRLRCENELGFKTVKWIAAIEFVHDFTDLGAGEGGYNEDHEFYGYRMPVRTSFPPDPSNLGLAAVTRTVTAPRFQNISIARPPLGAPTP